MPHENLRLISEPTNKHEENKKNKYHPSGLDSIFFPRTHTHMHTTLGNSINKLVSVHYNWRHKNIAVRPKKTEPSNACVSKSEREGRTHRTWKKQKSFAIEAKQSH